MTATAHQIELSDIQADVLASDARFKVCIAGRRGGKTHLALVYLLEAAIDHPGCEVWYLAETYKQAERVTWRKLKQMVPEEYIAYTNESKLILELTNGSRFALHGRENPDNLRGDGIQRMVNDEFCVQVKGDKGLLTWEESLRPMLSDTNGDALFISTPKGYNWGYDLYLRGLNKAAGWESFTWTTIEGGWVSASEVEQARKELNPRSFRQEYEASFESLSGRVYDYFSREAFPEGHIDADIVELIDQPIYVGQDFNVNPMAGVIAQKLGDQCIVLDSFEIQVSNTEEVGREILRRYPNRQVIFCPDPSGKARKTSAGGKTDFTILEKMGFKVRAPARAPEVKDRINNVQSNLRTAEGAIHVRIHPRATHLIRALDGMTYKEGTSEPDKTSGLDHVCDAFGYLMWQEFNRLASKARAYKVYI